MRTFPRRMGPAPNWLLRPDRLLRPWVFSLPYLFPLNGIHILCVCIYILWAFRLVWLHHDAVGAFDDVQYVKERYPRTRLSSSSFCALLFILFLTFVDTYAQTIFYCLFLLLFADDRDGRFHNTLLIWATMGEAVQEVLGWWVLEMHKSESSKCQDNPRGKRGQKKKKKGGTVSDDRKYSLGIFLF